MVQRRAEKENKGWITKTFFWVIRFLVTLLLFVYLFSFLVQFQDSVSLKSGEKVSGTIVRQLEQEVVVKLSDETKVYSRSEIEEKGVTLGLLSLIKQMDTGLFFSFSCLFFLNVMLASVRFQWILRPHRISLSYWDSLKINLVGLFFNNFLPGFTGGDLVRAYYTARHSNALGKAIVSVIMDRIIGVGGLVLLSSGMLLFHLGKPVFFLPSIFIFSCLGGYLVGAFSLFFLPDRFFKDRESWFARVLSSFCIYRNCPGVLIKSTAVTLVIHVFTNIMVAGYAKALGLSVPWFVFFIYVPIGYLLMAVPISLSGWGVGEAAFSYLFSQVGVSAGHSVVLSILNRLGSMIFSLLGGIVWMAFPLKKDRSTAPSSFSGEQERPARMEPAR